MPQLTWIGKEKVKNHHHDVPFHLLKKQYDFKADNDKPENSQNNILIQGDNLLALKSLLPKYEGKINCIYIDPPYNTGNTPENGGWIYNDNVSDPHIQKWIGEVVGKEGEDLTRHDKWLCMMYPRLKLLKKLLAVDGVIFISIDDIELANLRLICDEIFGVSNFIAILSVEINPKGRKNSNFISTTNDYCIIYAKNKSSIQFIENIPKNAKDMSKDENGIYIHNSGKRVLVGENDFNKPVEDFTSNKHYSIYHKDNNIIFKKEKEVADKDDDLLAKGYERYISFKGDKFILNTYTEEKLNALFNNKLLSFSNGKIYEKNTKSTIRMKSVISNQKYKAIIDGNEVDFEIDIKTTSANQNLNKILNDNKFTYPKNPEFIKLLLSLIDNKNLIILDSFFGSGTTAQSILELNAKDGGNRQFIGIEMMDYAENITAERIRRVINGYGSKVETQKGTGGGFSFYTIGETLFDTDGNLNHQADLISIREYIAHSEKLETIFDNDTSGYFLGFKYQTAYIFYYESDQITTLSLDFLCSLNADFMAKKPQDFVIYADKCTLTEEQLAQLKIRFKRIPRDISKL